MKLLQLKRNSLLSKVLLLLAANLIFLTLLLIGSGRYLEEYREEQLARDKLLHEALFYGEQLRAKLKTPITAAQSIADMLSTVQVDSLPEINREQANALLKETLSANKAYAAVSTVWETNAFDGMDLLYVNAIGHDITGAFIPRFYKTEDEDIAHSPNSNFYIENYYIFPRENHSPYLGPPETYKESDDFNFIYTASSPILYKGRFLGVVLISHTLEDVLSTLENLDAGAKDYQFSLYTHDGTVVYHSQYEALTGKSSSQVFENFELELKNIQNASAAIMPQEKGLTAHIPLRFGQSGFQWQLRIHTQMSSLIPSQGQTIAVYTLLALLVLIALAIDWIYIRQLLAPIKQIVSKANEISKGRPSVDFDMETRTTEYLSLQQAYLALIDYMRKLSQVTSALSAGNLDIKIEQQDALGKALGQLKENLIANKDTEEKRKEEDAEKNWINVGLARFNDILHQRYEDITGLAFHIMQELVNYLNVNQGGIFLYENQESEEYDTEKGHLKLTAAIAYEERKYLNMEVSFGEGLVGTCALEQKAIYMKKVPEDYIKITSGLGEATPRYLMLVPLLMKEQTLGVIELASFYDIPNYKQDFLGRLAESVATTISASQTTERTALLLQRSKQQAEEMAAQEEEMRQNLEELTATQEELTNKQHDLHAMTRVIDISMQKMLLSTSGMITEVNDNFLKVTGYENKEIIGQHHRKLLEKDKLNEFMVIWDSIMDGNDYHGQTKWIRRDGTLSWNVSTYTPVFDESDEITKILYVGYDITRTKEMEESLDKLSSQLDTREGELKNSQEELNKLKGQYDKELKDMRETNRKLRAELDRLRNTNL